MKQKNQVYVERLHAKGKEQLYIACEELNFAWLKSEVAAVKMAWNAGKPIWEIAALVRRSEEEVAILIIDLTNRNQLQLRPGGILGTGKAS